MAERKLNGIWNVERILKEYLSLADNSGHIRNIDLSDDSPHGIKVRRFAAAMKAYGKTSTTITSLKILSATFAHQKR